MKKYDLHIHSHYSIDSLNRPEDLVNKFNSLGFSGFAITDHGKMFAAAKARDYAKEKSIDIEIINACEFMSDKGEVIGLFLQEMISKKDFGELCDAIHDQGGFVILPHPFDTTRGSACNPEFLPPELVRLVDGIEVINGHCVNPEYNKKAREYAEKTSLPMSAGSDAHFIFECGKAYVEITDSASLDIALKKKQTIPMGNPFPLFSIGLPTITRMAKKWGLISKPKE